MEIGHSDTDFGNTIFSEDEDATVDMEFIKKNIKLVPLSDMDFSEPSDNIMEIDPSLREHILGPLRLTIPEHLDFKASLNQEKTDKDFPDLESLGEANILKQVKTEVVEIGIEVGNSKSTAAKVAAEVAADVVTSGIVTEPGPRPDFSSWTAEDDILLKNAMEVGAAIEALAKGAVQFSQKFTVRELRERWRALLYDPEISEEAATRMLRCEAFTANQTKSTNPNKLKYPFRTEMPNKKRELSSLRTLIYKKMRIKEPANLNSDQPGSNLDSQTNKQFPDAATKLSEVSMPETPFSEMVKLFASSAVIDAVKATPPVVTGQSFMDVEMKTSKVITDSKVGSCPADNGQKKPQSVHNDTGHELDAEMHTKSDTNLSSTAQPVEAQSSTSQLKSASAVQKTHKPLTVDILSLENMICVLNTEDTEIPSPPPGSGSHLSPLFSTVYLPSDIKGDKNEKEITSAGYRGTENHVETAVRNIKSSFVDDKKSIPAANSDPGCVTTQGLVSNKMDITTPVKDKEVMELSESLGKGLLASQPLSSADEDLPLSHSDGIHESIRDSTLPPQAALFGQVDQGLCSADNSVDDPPTVKSVVICPGYENGVESDDEMPSFSDVESMILDMDLDPLFDEDALARAESRRLYRRHRKTIMRLEQGANAALERALTLRGAIAVLYGQHLCSYITKNEVSLGRETLDIFVDIDLGKEGRANKVSRKQATIKLKKDGVFYLKNLGRKDLCVNNIPIPHGQHASLGSNCLIEVGGMRFIFEINKKLVKQRVAEMCSSQQNG